MEEGRWLLLLHHIPPKPPYFRAKVLRRLAQVGALPLKNSAYLLPSDDDTLEDFEWICQEVGQQGGSAWLFRVETLAGISEEQLKDAFRQLREPDYEELIQTARSLLAQTGPAAEAAYARLLRRREELSRIDFFGSPRRQELEDLVTQIGDHLRSRLAAEAGAPASGRRGRVWVTRAGVKVDRIASAWLIRRHIDPDAVFKFVVPDAYVHAPGELRFDMFVGEYTHRGDLCTFEVLLEDFHLGSDAALVAIAEMVHDIDLKQDRYQRAETAGLARMLEGVYRNNPSDEARIEKGGLIFEGFYQSFRE
jgi:hypothetical protein